MPLVNLPVVAVSNVTVAIVPASSKRRKVMIVQTSANPIRVGGAGVTAATGYRLAQNERVELESTEAIYAIREGGADGSISAVDDRRR